MQLRLELVPALAGSIVLTFGSHADPAQDDRDRPVEQRSPVQRGARAPAANAARPANDAPAAAQFPAELRSLDGVDGAAAARWGSAGATLRRWLSPDYADGAHAPAGSGRPSARAISNGVCAQDDLDRPNALGLSDFLWQWGQFLDHDLDETPVTDPGEAFDIAVPLGDAWFDPGQTGEVTIPLDRSAYRVVDGVRQQLNNITAFIDGSQVYGSDAERARALRSLDGTGRLATSDGDLLPYNVHGLDNAPSAELDGFFLAGDLRANEQVGLTAMHTLFVREHNRIADELGVRYPDLGGDLRYEFARALVAATLQAITFEEFLPHLLGADALPPYRGYHARVDPSISNVFATAAYRVGHTMLSTRILRLAADGSEHSAGHLDLAAAFFAPHEIELHGIEPVLRGLAAQPAQDVDPLVVDAIRNFLFGAPGAGGFDLAALNLQRGRDHGLPGYQAIRTALGRDPARSFADVSDDPLVQARLAATFDHVDQIDAWVGLLAEPHRPGAAVGESLFRILREQFLRLRDGDRFWYESYLPPRLANEARETRLSDVIRRNSAIGDELADDVFVVARAGGR